MLGLRGVFERDGKHMLPQVIVEGDLVITAVREGVVLDYDAAGKVLGIGASQSQPTAQAQAAHTYGDDRRGAAAEGPLINTTEGFDDERNRVWHVA